jgi:hypothetical protein
MLSRTEILQQHGITDRSEIRISVVQEGKSLNLVGIAGVGDPLKAISPKKAQELSIQLTQIGENDLAAQISSAAQKAHHANGNV